MLSLMNMYEDPISFLTLSTWTATFIAFAYSKVLCVVYRALHGQLEINPFLYNDTF